MRWVLPRVAWAALAALGLLASGCLGPASGRSSGEAPEIRGPSAGGFSSTSIFGDPSAYDATGLRSKVLAPGPYKQGPEMVVNLASKIDSQPIQIGIVRPDLPDTLRVPVVVAPSYLYVLLVEGKLRNASAGPTIPWWLFDNFVSHGYAVALVPVRGTSGNGGCWLIGSKAEQSDLNQAFTWLAEQPWSNGNLGSIGLSGEGYFQWEMAATGNPALKTIVPAGSFPDAFEFLVHNGTSFSTGPLFPALLYQFSVNPLGAGAFNVQRHVIQNKDYAGVVQPSRDPERISSAAYCPRVAEFQDALLRAWATGERQPAAFWAERDYQEAIEENYRGSVLLVHGLLEGTVYPHAVYPWIHRLEERGVTIKTLLGGWSHSLPDEFRTDRPMETPRADFAEILLHWFDYWLKGDLAVDLGPRVQVADSSNNWRNEDSWPPADAQPTTFYLAPGDRMVREPSSAAGRELLVPNPATMVPITNGTRGGAIDRPDLGARCKALPDSANCAVFRTDPFDREFRFAGLPRLHVSVTPLGPGGHLTAYLYAVGPEADQYHRLGWGGMNLRFAEGGETPKEVLPNQRILARMELEPLDAVVPAGWRLELMIAQGSYGTGDTFFGTDHYGTPIRTNPVELEFGQSLSMLTLHTFERASGAFFEAPPP